MAVTDTVSQLISELPLPTIPQRHCTQSSHGVISLGGLGPKGVEFVGTEGSRKPPLQKKSLFERKFNEVLYFQSTQCINKTLSRTYQRYKQRIATEELTNELRSCHVIGHTGKWDNSL